MARETIHDNPYHKVRAPTMITTSHPHSQSSTSTALSNLNLSLNETDTTLLNNIYDFTKNYFKNPKFDASHNFKHVLRVTDLAVGIYNEEIQKQKEVRKLDYMIVVLGALLHDVDDKKYVSTTSSLNGENGSAGDENGMTTTSLAKAELVRLGVNDERAGTIQTLIDGVSYSSEIKNLQHVRDLIGRIPELAVVQDADRLDAIGAVGIARCFTFGGAKRRKDLENSIEHFEDKLLKLEGMMKTETGKRMAVERSRRIREFLSWWKDETSGSANDSGEHGLAA